MGIVPADQLRASDFRDLQGRVNATWVAHAREAISSSPARCCNSLAPDRGAVVGSRRATRRGGAMRSGERDAIALLLGFALDRVAGRPRPRASRRGLRVARDESLERLHPASSPAGRGRCTSRCCCRRGSADRPPGRPRTPSHVGARGLGHARGAHARARGLDDGRLLEAGALPAARAQAPGARGTRPAGARRDRALPGDDRVSRREHRRRGRRSAALVRARRRSRRRRLPRREHARRDGRPPRSPQRALRLGGRPAG